MEPLNALRFAVSDRINDAEVGLKHVPLSLLGEFQKDVTEFLRGTSRDIDPSEVLVSMEDGSLALVATGLMAATTLWADLARLETQDALSRIDPKRAAVIERWQASSRQNPHRVYRVADVDERLNWLISHETSFRKVEDPWVAVEKYVHGRIVDWGARSGSMSTWKWTMARY